jgi:peroxiredoxin
LTRSFTSFAVICRVSFYFCLLSIACVFGEPAVESGVKAGHSIHGESFSEGPRQKAELLTGVTGTCHFPVTTTKVEAQKFFDQGVAQLHGFWFLEAERSFRQVLSLDADCAMAYWGMAMANVENADRARKIMAEGMRKKLDHLTKFERAWMQSLSDYYERKKGGDDEKARLRNLVRDWEGIAVESDDIEAKAFLVGRIWRNHAYHDLKISSHLSVDALANEVLARAPRHPGIHHYRIHLWNNEKDERALDSAAAIGPSCAGIAHDWHMGGHTYSILKRYADAAWQQEASARVDHAHMVRYHVMPDEIHNYPHNNGWLVENLGFVGRVREAIALAQNLIELPRIPRSKAGVNTAGQDWDVQGSSWAEGRRRLVHTLLEFELWSEALRLENSPYLESSGDFDEDIRLAHVSALAHFETGDALGGLRKLTALFEKDLSLQKDRDASANAAEKKARDEKAAAGDMTKAAASARKPFDEKIKRLREVVSELLVVQKITAGDLESAKESLNDIKGVPEERLARYFARTGDHEKAVELAKKSAVAARGQVAPLANYSGVLLGARKEAEARAEFEKLRAVAAMADLDLPVFQRLGVLANGDWRTRPQLPTDIGERPPLDQLGPRHWHPPAARPFEVAGADGRMHTLAGFKGRPLVVIFYLGRKCPHCLEQLNAFAPKAAGFSAAGIALLAVGTDSIDGLRETVGSDKNPFPFPLASDASMTAFKAYRAYDDFEQQPLHSTVLIDGNGLIRWQHVSFNPFMKPDFILEEAKRLLKFPATPGVVAEVSKLRSNE